MGVGSKWVMRPVRRLLQELIIVLIVNAASGDVVALDGRTFHSHLSQNSRTLVQYVAPWCGHCKKLAPEYEKAAALLQGHPVSLAKVDATVEKALAQKQGVKGFPTLLWYEDGEHARTFDGITTSDGITEWVKSMLAPVVKTGRSGSLSKEKPEVVLYATSVLDSFHEAAKKQRQKFDWRFVKGLGETKVAVTHWNEDPIELVGDGCSSKSEVLDFITNHSMPLFGSLDGDSFDRYVEVGKGLIWSLLPSEPSGLDAVVAKFRPMMQEIAKEFKSKYLVTYTDTKKFGDAIDNILSIKEYPAIAVQKKPGDKKKFVYTGEMTSSTISQFIRDVDGGKIEPKYKSEPTPVVSDDVVRRVVADTLREDVFQPSKDVVLQVYAPWCGHCKKLEPEYRTLAQKIQNDGLSDLLTIAWIDGTANDSPVESMDWSIFPTIYFVKAGNPAPILYEGERNAKAIWRYLKKHATKNAEINERLERKRKNTERTEEL